MILSNILTIMDEINNEVRHFHKVPARDIALDLLAKEKLKSENLTNLEKSIYQKLLLK
jgi:hypothetical protein